MRIYSVNFIFSNFPSIYDSAVALFRVRVKAIEASSPIMHLYEKRKKFDMIRSSLMQRKEIYICILRKGILFFAKIYTMNFHDHIFTMLSTFCFLYRIRIDFVAAILQKLTILYCLMSDCQLSSSIYVHQQREGSTYNTWIR